MKAQETLNSPKRVEPLPWAVDGAVARACLMALRAAGLSFTEITRGCDLDGGTLDKIWSGRQRRVRRTTALALLRLYEREVLS